jgi:AmmeMemoRadiSam system protein B
MGRNLNDTMEKIKILSIALLGILIMGMPGFYMSSDTIIQRQSGDVAVIIPHHMIVSAKIDDLLGDLAKSYDFERIIILSPNHFNYGFRYIQTTNNSLDSMRIDIPAVTGLNAGQSAIIENKDFQKEHGIMSEIPFIKKYWPAAQLIPITIKTATPEWRLKKLSEELSRLNNKKTLIIASLDFSHYCTEETARKNDRRFLDWISAHSKTTDKKTSGKRGTSVSLEEIKQLAISYPDISTDAIAIDSAETFYAFWLLKSAKNLNDRSPFGRTSSAEITGNTDPSQNTTHIFATFK